MINTKYKTNYCRYMQNGVECPLGDKCHFAHSPAELRKFNDVKMDIIEPLPTDAPTMNPGWTAPKQTPVPIDVSTGLPYNYKTVKCKYYEMGHCNYGDKCSFAHGFKEVRSIVGFPDSRVLKNRPSKRLLLKR